MSLLFDDRVVGRLCSLALALLLSAACKSKSQPPPPTPVPSPSVSDASTAPVAQALDAAATVAPDCIPDDARVATAHMKEGALVACYHVEDAGTEDCWRLDLSTRAWTFASQQPHVDAPPPPAPVTATPTAAEVCKPDRSECKTVPLSGIVVGEDGGLDVATNSDRSIVAVLPTQGSSPPPVHVFDATGKRLATIKPWKTPMEEEGPAFFRGAHVLGDVVEVRISDTPMSSAIRLYDSRGKKIADVFGGKSMDDGIEPFQLGSTRYAFVTMDEKREVVDVDVATGKQVAVYRMPGGVEDGVPLLAGTADGIVGVIGQTVFVGSKGGKVSEVPPPHCK